MLSHGSQGFLCYFIHVVISTFFFIVLVEVFRDTDMPYLVSINYKLSMLNSFSLMKVLSWFYFSSSLSGALAINKCVPYYTHIASYALWLHLLVLWFHLLVRSNVIQIFHICWIYYPTCAPSIQFHLCTEYIIPHVHQAYHFTCALNISFHLCTEYITSQVHWIF